MTAYSLYGHLFQTRLRYTQYQVNLVAVIAELGLYLFVPVFGYVCDRYGPRPASFLSAVFFGSGYFLAAYTYRSGAPVASGGEGWPFTAMLLAFALIGVGTTCMYLGAVTTCAKNFGRSKHKGFALAAPIASFGLGGMWQSQVGSRLLYERSADGSRGDVDVFRYFIFLGGLLIGIGLIGTFLLQIVDEEELIDEAIEELERSGLLEDSEFFRAGAANANGYGTIASQNSDARSDTEDLDAHKRDASEEARKKAWLLNEETRRFLSDKTMWWLAAGFFLVTGPGEAYLNNLGTIIGTLYPAPTDSPSSSSTTQPVTTAATHVSIVAITSTIARLLSGFLSDLFAPTAPLHQHRRGPASLTASLASLDPLASPHTGRSFTLSRMTLLLCATFLLSLGQLLLASGAVQNHASSRFWLVSAAVGTGYGAVFALVPIIVSVVWGVENFGTAWGIIAVVPAGGAAVWSAVYAAVYERGVLEGDPDGRCYGKQCYQSTFWAMTVAVWVACGLWFWAWRGVGGWHRRAIAV